MFVRQSLWNTSRWTIRKVSGWKYWGYCPSIMKWIRRNSRKPVPMNWPNRCIDMYGRLISVKSNISLSKLIRWSRMYSKHGEMSLRILSFLLPTVNGCTAWWPTWRRPIVRMVKIWCVLSRNRSFWLISMMPGKNISAKWTIWNNRFRMLLMNRKILCWFINSSLIICLRLWWKRSIKGWCLHWWKGRFRCKNPSMYAKLKKSGPIWVNCGKVVRRLRLLPPTVNRCGTNRWK